MTTTAATSTGGSDSCATCSPPSAHAVGDRVVGLRISGAEMDADGLTDTEVLAVCKAIAAQVDYLSVVAGTSASLGGSVHIVPPMGLDHAYVAPFAAAIRAAAAVPVIAAGRINQPQIAEQMLARGEADLCGMTRAMICDPEMPAKARDRQPGRHPRLHRLQPSLYRARPQGLGDLLYPAPGNRPGARVWRLAADPAPQAHPRRGWRPGRYEGGRRGRRTRASR